MYGHLRALYVRMDGDRPLSIACVRRVHEDAHTITHKERCHLLGQAAGGFMQIQKPIRWCGVGGVCEDVCATMSKPVPAGATNARESGLSPGKINQVHDSTRNKCKTG